MNKIIFFDVDGTLVDVKPAREYVPESTKLAIQETRKKGNLCFLCTGRSKAEIFDHILEIGFDGIIGAGGGFVEIHNKTLFHKLVSMAQINHVVDYFENNHFDYYVESNDGLFASKNLIKKLESLTYGDLENDENARKKKQQSPSHFIEALKEGYDLKRNDINKICFLENSDISFSKIKEEFNGEFNVIQCTVPFFGEDSGELAIKGVSKRIAIEKVIDYLNIDKKNTYAYGDGMNDQDMLEFCQYGIAVGNAKEELKKIANEVCEDIAENGIYNSMKKHKLI